MKLDDEICLCFHVSRRKLENFARLHQPQVPSQMSECGGAGTGCGWCIPFLKMIFRQSNETVDHTPLDQVTTTEYADQRALYVREGGGVPPSDATPLPDPHSP